MCRLLFLLRLNNEAFLPELVAMKLFVHKKNWLPYSKKGEVINPSVLLLQGHTNKTAKPAKITIVATSSHYGGDFTGMKVTGSVGVGSELWVDEFELLYE